MLPGPDSPLPDSVPQIPFEELWNSDHMRKLRLSFLRGDAPPECKACFLDESEGTQSTRQIMNQVHAQGFERVQATGPDGSISADGVLSLDLRLSNLCNFRCRSCGPHNSTAWTSDGTELGMKVGKSELKLRQANRHLWPWVESRLPFVERIHFAGGEPLILADHYEIIDRLIALGRTEIALSYNTNLSVTRFKGRDVTTLWERFRKLEVFVSLDGVGAAGEILRKGLDWPKTERRFLALRDRLPHARFKLFITVSAMNAFHLTQAFDRLISNGMIQRPDDFILNFADDPMYISLEILNAEEQRLLRSRNAEFLEGLRGRVTQELFAKVESSLAKVLLRLPSELTPVHRRGFRSYMMRLDRLRRESFIRAFPEHLGILYDER
ncbi:MAG TPA: twitch domain-containing radical SAM protein [Bdellovibrionota bacterium]|nr:twitch domain-containing radical SAM protein [Bdellovibrionota bacterium]